MNVVRGRSAARESILRISPRKLTLLPLVAATYFMVSGGPFGIEEIVEKSGYMGTLLILVITPLLWSLPTALMVSELASAIPDEGGFYIWVKRSMGPFWGYQETWLSLVGSFFDMAIYPTLFVAYLGRLVPGVDQGHWKTILGLAMIAICTIWNICGTRAVGEGSIYLGFLLLSPFAVLVVFAFLHRSPAGVSHAALWHADILGGILIAMWNFMGWDNVSTIGGEVDRPQRTYPLAMACAVALVVIAYLIPVAAVSITGINPNSWTDGGWVDLGRTLGGAGLATALALAGVVGAFGSFNSLMLSLTRLPMVMSADGYLPKVFARRHPRTGVPWVAIITCAIGWAFCFQLGFEPLVILDVLLTGLSILLEFWALVALRIREPELERPYRVPGGLAGAFLIGLGPLALIVVTIVRNRSENAWGLNALTLGFWLVAAGPILYLVSWIYHRGRGHGRPAVWGGKR